MVYVGSTSRASSTTNFQRWLSPHHPHPYNRWLVKSIRKCLVFPIVDGRWVNQKEHPNFAAFALGIPRLFHAQHLGLSENWGPQCSCSAVELPRTLRFQTHPRLLIIAIPLFHNHILHIFTYLTPFSDTNPTTEPCFVHPAPECTVRS